MLGNAVASAPSHRGHGSPPWAVVDHLDAGSDAFDG